MGGQFTIFVSLLVGLFCEIDRRQQDIREFFCALFEAEPAFFGQVLFDLFFA